MSKHAEDLERAEVNLRACAYNAFVSSGMARGAKKMRHLGEAINWYERAKGRVKLDALIDAGVIESYKPCPAECIVRPGGLFHAKGCENDSNHPVDRDRVQRARELLPGGPDGHGGWRAASVSLVGEPADDQEGGQHGE